MSRTIELLRLIKTCGKIEGRKKIQKIVHILKEYGQPFSYRYGFHFHGPFSAELKAEIDLLVSEKLVVEEESSTGSASYRQYIYSSTPFLEDILKDLNKLEEPIWSGLARTLNDKSPQELEAISTLIYLARNGVSHNEIQARFEQLKPHLAGYYSSSDRFISDLATQNARSSRL